MASELNAMQGEIIYISCPNFERIKGVARKQTYINVEHEVNIYKGGDRLMTCLSEACVPKCNGEKKGMT